nr:probable galacturonosyltransferase 6 isoform X1 [Ipomoea trifida]
MPPFTFQPQPSMVARVRRRAAPRSDPPMSCCVAVETSQELHSRDACCCCWPNGRGQRTGPLRCRAPPLSNRRKATADAHRELLLRDVLLHSHGTEKTQGREREIPAATRAWNGRGDAGDSSSCNHRVAVESSPLPETREKVTSLGDGAVGPAGYLREASPARSLCSIVACHRRNRGRKLPLCSPETSFAGYCCVEGASSEDGLPETSTADFCRRRKLSNRHRRRSLLKNVGRKVGIYRFPTQTPSPPHPLLRLRRFSLCLFLVARALSATGSKSHLVKEIKMRIKDLERAMGEVTKDSDLSRSIMFFEKPMLILVLVYRIGGKQCTMISLFVLRAALNYNLLPVAVLLCALVGEF